MPQRLFRYKAAIRKYARKRSGSRTPVIQRPNLHVGSHCTESRLATSLPRGLKDLFILTDFITHIKFGGWLAYDEVELSDHRRDLG